MNLFEIDNTACRIKSLFNDQMYPKSTQTISQQIVYDCFTNQIVKHPQTNINEIANTVCLIKSRFNDQMITKSTK